MSTTPSRWANYPHDMTGAIGNIVGPNTLSTPTPPGDTPERTWRDADPFSPLYASRPCGRCGHPQNRHASTMGPSDCGECGDCFYFIEPVAAADRVDQNAKEQHGA